MHASKTFENIDPAKQQRVLDAALHEFAEHGYHLASMNRLAAALGIAKGSIFKYFGTKETLFRLVFGRGVDVFACSLRRVRHQSAGQDFFTRIRRSLDAALEFVGEHPRIYRLYLTMLFQERFPLRETLLAEVRQASTRYLAPLVDEAKARGELRPDLDTAAAVFLLDAAMDRLLQARAVAFMEAGLPVHSADDADLSACVDSVLDALQRGLGA